MLSVVAVKTSTIVPSPQIQASPPTFAVPPAPLLPRPASQVVLPLDPTLPVVSTQQQQTAAESSIHVPPNLPAHSTTETLGVVPAVPLPAQRPRRPPKGRSPGVIMDGGRTGMRAAPPGQSAGGNGTARVILMNYTKFTSVYQGALRCEGYRFDVWKTGVRK